MKKLISIIFCLLIICVSVTAGVKIALIGDSAKANQVADLVLVKLADNNALEFLERSVIEKVLHEHKFDQAGLISRQLPIIANILHSDIFAVLSSAQIGKQTVPSSLRVFDARNGFCLIDTALPAKIAECAEFIAVKLKNAIKVLQDKQRLKFISILAVRNVGAPAKYKRQMAHIAIEIERRLIAMPDVAVLERSELGLVNRERKLTDKLFKLAPSAYLLDLEFAPSSSADKVDLHIYVLNTSGKELKSLSFSSCLEITPEKIIKVLAEYLKSSTPLNLVSTQVEARHFFAEYQYAARIGHHATAKGKIETAIALDFKQHNYRRNLAYLLMAQAKKNISPKNNNHKYFKMLRDGLLILSEIRKENPNYRVKILFSSQINVFNSFVNRYHSSNIPNELIECVTIYRYNIRSELLHYYPTELSADKPFKSIKTIKNYRDFFCAYNRFINFLSKQQTINSYFVDLNNYLDRSSDFFKTHPDELKEMTWKNQIYLGPFSIPIALTGTGHSLLFFKAANQHRAVITKMQQHQLSIIRAQGALLELYANLDRNNFNPVAFKNDVIKYFKYIAPLFPPINSDRRTIYSWSHWEGLDGYLYFQYKLANRRILRQILNEQSYYFRLNRNTYNVSQLFSHIFRAKKDRSEFLKRVLVLKKIKNMQHISSSNEKDLQRRLKIGMRRLKPILINYGRADLYNELEIALGFKRAGIRQTVIEGLLVQGGSFWQNHNSNGKFLAAEILNDNIFFCFKDVKRIKGPRIFSYTTLFFRLNLKTKKIQQISSYKGDIINGRFGSFHNSLIYQGIFYLACKNGVLAFPLDAKRPYMIDQLPGKYVYAIAGLNGKLFIAIEGKELSDNNAPPPQLVVIACKPNGTDRNIIFSSLDRKKRNFFDLENPFRIEYMWGDAKKNRLLFVACKPFGGLWEYYPAGKSSKQLCNLSPLASGWGKNMNGKLYFSMQNSLYFEYNPNDDHTRLLYCNKEKNSYYTKIAKKYSGLEPEVIQSNWGWVNRFCKVDNLLYYGYDCNLWMLNLKNPKNPTRIEQIKDNHSEFILLPSHDKGLIVVSSKEIFYLNNSINPKEVVK